MGLVNSSLGKIIDTWTYESPVDKSVKIEVVVRLKAWRDQSDRRRDPSNYEFYAKCEAPKFEVRDPDIQKLHAKCRSMIDSMIAPKWEAYIHVIAETASPEWSFDHLYKDNGRKLTLQFEVWECFTRVDGKVMWRRRSDDNYSMHWTLKDEGPKVGEDDNVRFCEKKSRALIPWTAEREAMLRKYVEAMDVLGANIRAMLAPKKIEETLDCGRVLMAPQKVEEKP